MKKILFFFLLITANVVYGQYTPMLEIGNIWNMYLHFDFPSGFYFDLEITETVEIEGLTYFHIEATHNSCDLFLREDINEKKIYAIWDGQEHLHYDFSLDIGDYAWYQDMFITDIGYGDFFGMENLRYYVLDNYWKLIEGIGFEYDGIADAFEYGCLCEPVFESVELISMNEMISVDEIASNKISFYPNPTRNRLNVNNANLNIQSIQLYDVLGKKVLVALNNFQQIDVSNLNQGVYLVKIETDKGVFTKKALKE